MKMKLKGINKDNDNGINSFTDKVFKNHYRILKRSIKVYPRSNNIDNDMCIEMDVKEISSNKVIKFSYNDGWDSICPDRYVFDIDDNLMMMKLKPLFREICENNS